MRIIVLSKGQGKIDVLYCWILRSLKKTNVVQKYIVKNRLVVKKKKKSKYISTHVIMKWLKDTGLIALSFQF